MGRSIPHGSNGNNQASIGIMMQSDEEYQYLPHGKPIPEGWELANNLQNTHHGHHAVLIKKKLDESPKR